MKSEQQTHPAGSRWMILEKEEVVDGTEAVTEVEEDLAEVEDR